MRMDNRRWRSVSVTARPTVSPAKLLCSRARRLTEAIGTALRERLERVGAQRDQGRVARLVAIGERCAAHWERPANSGDHGALLYDERGLPR